MNIPFSALGRALSETQAGRILTPGPLEMFKREQFNKLRGFMGQRGFMDNLQSVAKPYFQGSNVEEISEQGIRWSQANEKLGTYRKAIAGTAFGLAAANTLGISAFGATEQATNVGMLGAHYTVGSALMGMGGKPRLAGMGYLGMTAYNTLFNEGDNPGPM